MQNLRVAFFSPFTRSRTTTPKRLWAARDHISQYAPRAGDSAVAPQPLSETARLLGIGGLDSKESAYRAGDLGSYPWVREIRWVRKVPWRRAWQPTPVILPGESPWTKSGGLQPMGVTKSRTALRALNLFLKGLTWGFGPSGCAEPLTQSNYGIQALSRLL